MLASHEVQFIVVGMTAGILQGVPSIAATALFLLIECIAPRSARDLEVRWIAHDERGALGFPAAVESVAFAAASMPSL